MDTRKSQATETRRGVGPTLVQVAEFPTRQVTGVTVSRQGRLFVCFPYWWPEPNVSVAELGSDGALLPYPTHDWNVWQAGMDPQEHFVCVQSVVVDANDMLWVLDPAAPMMKETVPHGPKLVQIDLRSQEVVQIIPFEEPVAPRRSYLNDVRVDVRRQFAYITESNLGALIAVDLRTGHARRLLAHHHSTKSEDIDLTVQGKLLREADGSRPQIHSDGIALDPDGEFLYWHALTGHTLYRIRTEFLRDERITADDLALHVETLGRDVACDGMIMDPAGNLYLTALEQNAIYIRRPDGRQGIYAQDEHLAWPDTLAIGPDNFLYVTTSRIEEMPRFNKGKDMRTKPYGLFKAPLSE